MTDRYELSRRKVLAGLGTIGLAGAGAGLGTTAYFSDEETFKNNTLTAGSLDLKVDWQEHYSDWSADEGEGLDNDVIMAGGEDGVGAEYVGLPDPANPLIYVHEDDLLQFMMNTAVEAFPDPDDDGIQELETEDFTYSPCQDGADTPEDLDPREGYRTFSEDTIGTVNDRQEPYPLVYLEDVKPGDFGELTLSFHLCDNPGYVWMNGQLVSASENGVTEPEMKDPDEDYPDGDTVELLDSVQTLWWYDTDGDNVLDQGAEQTVCAHLVLDSSGSMTSTDGDGVTRQDEMKTGAKQLANAILGAGGSVGVTEFDSDANVLTGQSEDATTVENAIDSVDADGGTAIDTGINVGDGELAECPEDTRHVMIVVTDGQNNDGTGPVQTASDNAIGSNTDEIYAIGTGGANQSTLEAIANPDDDAHIENTTDLTQAIANLSEVLLGEEVIFRGTLRESLNALATDNGIPLDGNRETPYNEVAAVGDETNPENGTRECFAASDTQYIGFAWWLPVDHGNEVQTDSVKFDLGFYTEQCRHNAGSGMGNLVPTRPGTGFAKLSEETNIEAGYGQDGENFNSDGTSAGGARARFGNNALSGSWELAVGDEPGASGEFAQENYEWTPGQEVPWTLTWDGTDLTFEFDGVAPFSYELDEAPDGRIAIQGKADEASVDAMIEELIIDGQLRELSGENSISVTNDGDGRAIEYLVLNTGLTGDQTFSISGTATVTLGDYGGSEEGVAFDIVLE